MTGITIVFIHGNFVTKRRWEPWVARYEARGHTCITIAWPGRNQPVAELKRNRDDPFLGKLTIGEVIEHHVRTMPALPAKPTIIGHSFGALLTQLLVQRQLAAAAVAIDSVPAQGVLTLKWSFIRSPWPLLNPFIPASRPLPTCPSSTFRTPLPTTCLWRSNTRATIGTSSPNKAG